MLKINKMNKYELQRIWKKNLREFNDVMRLESIIIRSMQESIKEAQTKQCNIANVVESKPNEKAALKHAVNAIYFADYSDYLSGLYEVVHSLTGLDEPTEEDINNLFKELNP